MTTLLAPAGIATVTADPNGDLNTGRAVVVCGSAEADPDQVRAAVQRARTQGATFVAVAAGGGAVPAADEVIADDVDVLAFGGRILAALEVA